jgi:hypothetical protein
METFCRGTIASSIMHGCISKIINLIDFFLAFGSLYQPSVDGWLNMCLGVKHFQLTQEHMIWCMLMACYHLRRATSIDVLLLIYSWKLIVSYDRR